MSDLNDLNHACDSSCGDDCANNFGRCGEDRASQYRLYVSKEVLFFGAETVGTISEDIEVTLKNIGWADILIQSMQVTGPFVLDRTKCPDVLKPGREGKLTLNFVPTQWGAQSGSVFIKAGRAGEHYITMSGAGYTSNENGQDLAGIPIFKVLEDDGTPQSLKNAANLVYDAGHYAYVIADPVLAHNDFYEKVGPSGLGSWEVVGLLGPSIAITQRDMSDIALVTNGASNINNGSGLVPTRTGGSVPTLRKLQKNFDDALDAQETGYETSLTQHEAAYGTEITNARAIVTGAFDAPDPNNPNGVPGTVTVAPGVVVKTLSRTLTDVRDNNRFMVGTWAALAAITDRKLGATAEVPATDNGVHVDPVLATSVSNSGIFSLVAQGWRRIADFTAPVTAAVGDRVSTNKATTPVGVEAQITAHLGDTGAAGQMNYRGTTTVQNALDQLFYAGIKITGLTVTPNQIEQGDAPSVTVSWNTSGNITSQTLNGVTVALGTTSKVFAGVNANTAFNLVMQDNTAPGGTVSATSSASVAVLAKWYAGISASTTPTDTAIRAFGAQGFATAKSRTISFNATGGGYPTYAWPASLGSISSVKVGGLTFSDYTVTTRNVVNAFGTSVSMNILVFNTLQNGAAIQVDFA